MYVKTKRINAKLSVNENAFEAEMSKLIKLKIVKISTSEIKSHTCILAA